MSVTLGARIWVHRKPLDGDYGDVREARAEDVLGLPDLVIDVDDILT